MFKLDKNKILILNIIIVLFGTLFLNILIDKNRYLIKHPDDFLHLLTKFTLVKDCKFKNENQCNGIKRINDLNYEKFEDFEKSKLERQKHRLTTSYNPLYTFLLSKLSLDSDIFISQKYFHYLLSIFLSIMIIFYVRFFIKEEKYIFLILLIYISHFFLRGGYGLHFAIPTTLSAFLSGLSIIFLFNKKKLISCLFLILSITMHHVGILFCILNFSAFKIYEFISYKKKNFFLKKQNLIEIFSFSFLLFFSFLIKYNIFDNINLSFNVYETYFTNYDFLKVIFDNFFILSKYLFFTILILNPLLIFFISKNFFNKDKGKILFLKIIFCTSLIFIIMIPIGSTNSSLSFVFGNRIWEIFILNIIILTIFQISIVKSKNEIIIKKLFIWGLPIFIFLNLFLLKDRSNYMSDYDDYYLDTKGLIKFNKELDDNDKILLDINETNFYYLLNTGLIKKDFYIKNFSTNDEIEASNFLIIDNPVKLLNRSSLFLKKNDIIQIDNEYELIKQFYLYSLSEQKISINKNNFLLKKGLNKINTSNNSIKFGNIKEKLYLIGIKTNESQKNFWPWDTNFKFSIITKIVKWKPLIDQKILITKEFDFSKLSKKISNKKIKDCQNQIISDSSSIIIMSNSCK